MTTRARIPLSLAQIHKVVGGELVGPPHATVTSLASFQEAGPNDLTFVTGDRMLKIGGPTAAGAILAHRRLAEIANPHIVVANPTLAFAQIAQTFFCPPHPSPRHSGKRHPWYWHASRSRCHDLARESRWGTGSRLARE